MIYKEFFFTSGSACSASGSSGWTGSEVSTMVDVGTTGVSTGGGLLGNGGGISVTIVV